MFMFSLSNLIASSKVFSEIDRWNSWMFFLMDILKPSNGSISDLPLLEYEFLRGCCIYFFNYCFAVFFKFHSFTNLWAEILAWTKWSLICSLVNACNLAILDYHRVQVFLAMFFPSILINLSGILVAFL